MINPRNFKAGKGFGDHIVQPLSNKENVIPDGEIALPR